MNKATQITTNILVRFEDGYRAGLTRAAEIARNMFDVKTMQNIGIYTTVFLLFGLLAIKIFVFV